MLDLLLFRLSKIFAIQYTETWTSMFLLNTIVATVTILPGNDTSVFATPTDVAPGDNEKTLLVGEKRLFCF